MLEHNMESSKSSTKPKILQAYRPKNVPTYINQDIEAKGGGGGEAAAAPLWRQYGIDVGLNVFRSVGLQDFKFFAGFL